MSVERAALAGAAVILPPMFEVGGYDVPALPAVVGLAAVALVRIIVVTKATPGRGLYNLAITLLAMLGCLVTIIDHDFGVGGAFWLGVGFGAVGVGIVEIGKSQFVAALRGGVQAAARAFLKGSPPEDPPAGQ